MGSENLESEGSELSDSLGTDAKYIESYICDSLELGNVRELPLRRLSG